MRYRRRLDILSEILQIAQKGALQTKIMYATNTSHIQLKGCLKELVDKGFLTYDTKQKRYYATEKGIELLTKYQEMKQMFIH